MHKILVNTHKESNINLLKTRDYFLDKARFINNCLRKSCLIGPVIISIVGMFVSSILRENCADTVVLQWLETHLDSFVGCISVILFVVDYVLKNRVDSNLSISNAFREIYDVRVLGIEPNKFCFGYSEEELQNYSNAAKRVKDKDKYCAWYREFFSNNDAANIICCMMDNVVYTYHAYSEYAKLCLAKLLGVSLLFVVYCVFYFTQMKGFVFVNPLVLFLAIFDFLTDVLESYVTSRDWAAKNRDLKEKVLSNADGLLRDDQNKNVVLRCIQDFIVESRENAIFIPKVIREKVGDNNSAYYRDLDEIKQIFWGKDATNPRCSGDFQICSVEDEAQLIDFSVVHTELLHMLEDVKDCLDRNHIHFMLDGGTLLGCYRASEHSSFLPWDDDVDIAVKSADVGRIKEVITKELGDKYDVQDYFTEESYSPRLATFRIRQKNSRSRVTEKDSELFELYTHQGLFVDVYAYSHILGCRWIDALYRSVLIHPINKRIRRVETNWKYDNNPSKWLTKFCTLKKKYIKRAMWYTKHAQNTKYVVYEPFYIYDLNRPGPYIKTQDMYGEIEEGIFEKTKYSIPSNSTKVLMAYYGKEWDKSPLLPIEELIQDDKLLYSKAVFDASAYKHLKQISIYERN